MISRSFLGLIFFFFFFKHICKSKWKRISVSLPVSYILLLLLHLGILMDTMWWHVNRIVRQWETGLDGQNLVEDISSGRTRAVYEIVLFRRVTVKFASCRKSRTRILTRYDWRQSFPRPGFNFWGWKEFLKEEFLSQTLLATSLSGVGWGTAAVHLCTFIDLNACCCKISSTSMLVNEGKKIWK